MIVHKNERFGVGFRRERNTSMKIEVDPSKLEELSAGFKSLARNIENGGSRVYPTIGKLIRETQNDYPEVQSTIREAEDYLREIHLLADSIMMRLDKKSRALTEAADYYRENERKLVNLAQVKAPPSSFYTKGGGLSGQGLTSYLQDPLFQDPAVQKLHLQAQNGTEEEKQTAKEKLDAIFKARDTIARAQVAYATYKAFGNKALMEQAHKEATKQREKLKGYGVSETLYGDKVNLSHLYTGTALQACSYDPSIQITKDGQLVQVLMPDDNQYRYLLGLVMKGGSQGAWGQKQLEEIHKLLSEIGRSQVAWSEYKAKDMKKEMDGAHTYAEKLRTQLKNKYSLSSEMVDDVDYKHLWTGTGFAGNSLNVKETDSKPQQSTDSKPQQSIDIISIAQQVVFGNEGGYSTVAKDDGKNIKTGYPGGVSIGKLQWHEGRAYDLLLKIIKKDMDAAQKILGENSKIYKELTDPSLSKNADRWKSRVLTDEEAKAISKLISTDVGKMAQDEQARLDMQSYLEEGKKLGISDEKALIYFADLNNQSPKRAREIVQDAGGGKGLTLEKIHRFALNNTVMGKYVTRRNTTFNKINNITFENQKSEVGSNPQNNVSPKQPSQAKGVKLDVERIDQKPLNSKGCAIASLAMLANFYGANTSFKTIESKFVNKDYMLNFAQAAKAYGLNYSEKRGITESEVLSLAKKSLDKGEPVIIQIYGTSKGKTYTHFVVAIGYTGEGSQAKDFIINDPWGGIETTLNKAQRYNQAPVSSIRYLTKE